MAAPSNIKKISYDEFDFITGTRPWVNGDAFIGPALKDLVLAYYIAQGENPKRAQEFADSHMQALRDKLLK